MFCTNVPPWPVSFTFQWSCLDQLWGQPSVCSVGLFTLHSESFVGLYTLHTFFSPGKLLIRGSFCGLKCYLSAMVCMRIVRGCCLLILFQIKQVGVKILGVKLNFNNITVFYGFKKDFCERFLSNTS